MRPDLLAVIRDAPDWALRCIEVGETSIKGYLTSCLIRTQIESLMQSVQQDELPRVLIRAAIEAEDVCLEILEKRADQVRTGELAHDTHQTSFSTPGDTDWDLMVSNI